MKEAVHHYNSENSTNKFKKFWGKFWFIVWKDNSPKGWIFSIIFLFIVIKFIFFPVLNLVTGTSLPLAIVESCSMYHSGNLFSNFDEWWKRHDDKYEEFSVVQSEFEDFKFANGFNKGDILFIIGVSPDKIKIGDVIIFQTSRRNPLIHRVIEIEESNGERTFSTVGDNNNGQLNEEMNIKESQIIGKAVFKLAPYLGWGKLIFFEAARSQDERGSCNEN